MKASLVFLAGLSSALVSQSSLANSGFTAEVYDLNSQRKTLLYNCKNQVTEKEGVLESLTDYTDPTSNLVLEERAKIKGSALIRFELDQKQIGVTASVEVKSDQVIFEKTQDGKTKTETEKLRNPLVISSSFTPFVSEHWSELKEGKTVSFRFASWERMETVGFEIKKIGEETIEGKNVLVLKMSASSFIIAAIVNPIIFKYADEGTTLMEMKGRTAPKRKVDSSWKDLDAEVVYHKI